MVPQNSQVPTACFSCPPPPPRFMYIRSLIYVCVLYVTAAIGRQPNCSKQIIIIIIIYFIVKLHRTKQRKNPASCQQCSIFLCTYYSDLQSRRPEGLYLKLWYSVVTPCRIRSLQRFGETYYFHRQGGRIWFRWMHKTTAWVTAVMKTIFWYLRST